MSEHPFTHDYIGLGLLDEASIIRHRDDWAAQYRHQGERYLEVYVTSGWVRILEYDDGARVGVSSAPTLAEAIGLRAADVLLGRVSRFWERVARTVPAVRVQTSAPNVTRTYIPGIGIGHLCFPMPLDVTWREPERGPVARRLGLAPFARSLRAADATLYRTVRGESKPRSERIRLVDVFTPGVLIAESVEGFHAANGPSRSVEWHPFLLPDVVMRVAHPWQAPPRTALADGGILDEFAIIEEMD